MTDRTPTASAARPWGLLILPRVRLLGVPIGSVNEPIPTPAAT